MSVNSSVDGTAKQLIHFQFARCSVSVSVSFLLLSKYVKLLSSYLQTSDDMVELPALKLSEYNVVVLIKIC